MAMEHHGSERFNAPRTITPLTIPAVISVGAGMLRFPYSAAELHAMVKSALDEDGAFNDLTTIATVVSDRHARGRLVARAQGVLCGIALALEAFRTLDPKVTMRVDKEDGTRLRPGDSVLYLSGHARALLAAERVALNFMQRLSGVASLTARYVDAVSGTRAKILDTRKTTPGWRLLEKYAVRAGGGTNHRLNLSTAVLIKDNHLASVDGDVGLAVRRARDLAPVGTKVEVECDRIEQVQASLDAKADIIMFDNMTTAQMRECVQLVAGRAITEASGGVNLDSVRAIAETGVDWISVGALTHSAPALDLALDFEMSRRSRRTSSTNYEHELRARTTAMRVVERVLRVPLLAKLAGANLIIVLAALVGVAIERRLNGPGNVVPILGLALAASLVVNLVLVYVALRPLSDLERTATRLAAGDMEARVPDSILADRDMARVGTMLNELARPAHRGSRARAPARGAGDQRAGRGARSRRARAARFHGADSHGGDAPARRRGAREHVARARRAHRDAARAGVGRARGSAFALAHHAPARARRPRPRRGARVARAADAGAGNARRAGRRARTSTRRFLRRWRRRCIVSRRKRCGTQHVTPTRGMWTSACIATAPRRCWRSLTTVAASTSNARKRGGRAWVSSPCANALGW